jgi:hypothetical protein
MAVRVNMVNKQYTILRDEYDPASVWDRIKQGQTFKTKEWGGNEITFNPDNVTNVHQELTIR